MIIVKVIGGLGNQMFTLAYARTLSLMFNEKIYIDCSSYKTYKIRPFSAKNLKIIDCVNYIEDANLSIWDKIYLKITSKTYRMIEKIKREIAKQGGMGKKVFQILAKHGLFYNLDMWYYDIPYYNYRLKHIYGYFQSHKYFGKYTELIKDELKVKTGPTKFERKMLKEITSCNAIGISIRLGDDYLNSNSNVCKEDYYQRGMDYVYRKNRDAVFFIFSDRIDRVKERFRFNYPVTYIEGFKDYESLRLLYSCNHFVIANSSFSWWGAFLAAHEGKIIVAPNRWFPSLKRKPDLYLDDMVLLEV